MTNTSTHFDKAQCRSSVTKTIAFANQKGGVGKTTTCREIGIYFASSGFKVLFIDCDPQGNLTKSLCDDDKGGLYELLIKGVFDVTDIDKNTGLITGDKRLAVLEKSLIGEFDAFTRLKSAFELKHFDEYDYVFIDCPPSLGILSVNALVCSTHVFIPVNPGLYSMHGTNDLFETLAKVRANFNPSLKVAGILINAYDPRANITREIKDEIKEVFKDKLFSVELSRSTVMEKAISDKKGIADMNKCKVQDEIKVIADELLKRLD